MDREAARIADIGDVIEQLQRIDEAAAGLLAAGQLEADEAAQAALEIFGGAARDARRSAPTGWMTWVISGRLRRKSPPPACCSQCWRMRSASVSNPCRVQERIERRHRRAEVAQQRDPRLDDVGDRPERLDRLGPHRAVIARIGRVQRRLARRMRGPVEIAAVDEEPADRGAVAADIFGRRVDDRPPRRDRTAAPGSARRYCP